MKVLNAVIHILDKDTGNIVLSQKEIKKDPTTIEYIEKVIQKFNKSEYVEVDVRESPIMKFFLDSGHNDFENAAKNLALKFFDSIKSKEMVPGGDLIFFRVETDNLSTIMGFVKLNYNEKFTHVIEYEDDILSNNIIRNKTILPSPSQKVTEGVMLEGELLKVQEKIYKGMTGSWSLTQDFLEIKRNREKVSDKIKDIKEIVENIGRDKSEDTFEFTSNMQRAIHDSVEMNRTIDNDYVADAIFMDDESAKINFKDQLSNKGLEEVIKVPNAKLFEKKYNKQKLKLGNGIELSVPINLLKNKDVIEFNLNNDGTTSVMIKNIDKIINRSI